MDVVKNMISAVDNVFSTATYRFLTTDLPPLEFCVGPHCQVQICCTFCAYFPPVHRSIMMHSLDITSKFLTIIIFIIINV
jgi:hypothetical protein